MKSFRRPRPAGRWIEMDARTDIGSKLPGRHGTAGALLAACAGATDAALHLPAIVQDRGIALDLFDAAEIFKKTPYVADLKPAGRYVAKDMVEFAGIPLLMPTLLDFHPDVVRSTDRPITVTGLGVEGS